MSNEVDEPPKIKRLKTEDENSFFREFLQQEIEKEKLESAYTSFCLGSADLVFRALEIQETNALLSEEFSRASCKVKMYEKDNPRGKPLPRLYAAGSIFRNGIFILKKFLGLDKEDPKPKVPIDGEQRQALRKLLNFLLQDHDSSLLENEKCDDAQWAVLVAQHLLLPLTVGDSYIIDECNDGLKKIVPKCLCKAGDTVHGILGDTSFGWVDGWHGRSDLLVNSVAVDLMYPEVNDLDVGSSDVSSSVSSAEIKSSSNMNDKDQQQVLAKTIVFSFLQHKENKGNIQNCLVPGIGISKKKVVIYFYDCEEDVLLGTTQMDLFGYKSLYYNTVVFLWLTLNYRLFCTGITNSMKICKAQFFTKVGSFLENYRNDVSRAITKKQKESEDDSGWTKTGVVEEKIDVKETIKNNEYFGIKLVDL